MRIASTSFGTTGWNGQIMDVAFRNPDGSTALVVHNENDDPRSFAVAVGDQSFEYTLPGGALATFTWPRSSPQAAYRPVSLAARPPPPSPAARPGARGRRRRLDPLVQRGTRRRRASTCRSTWAGASTFRRVAIDSGGNLGDYAARLAAVGQQRRHHLATLATGTGAGQLTTVDVTQTSARYLRITSTGTSDHWWSLADIRLYN